MTISQLHVEHIKAQERFRIACNSPLITEVEYETIRQDADAKMKAYHDAIEADWKAIGAPGQGQP